MVIISYKPKYQKKKLTNQTVNKTKLNTPRCVKKFDTMCIYKLVQFINVQILRNNEVLYKQVSMSHIVKVKLIYEPRR